MLVHWWAYIPSSQRTVAQHSDVGSSLIKFLWLGFNQNHQVPAVGFYTHALVKRSHMHHTSWKSCDISHTRQEFDCISHLCLSERKKSRSSGVCVRAWTIQFMKHVLPKFIKPRKPAGREERKRRVSTAMAMKIKHDRASDSYGTKREGMNHH